MAAKNSQLLGTEPIGQLLRQYAVPAIIAMVASSLYNIVDSIFIGQGCGPLAIAGLAVSFPFMNLSTAFGAMVGVGASTLISVRLGQKRDDEANHILGNTVTLNIVISLLFTLVTLLFLRPILTFFGASEAVMPYAEEYMEVVLLGNIITHSYFGLNSVLRAAGHPRKSMMATMVAICLNCILDPLFIFVLGWGIRGAAIATILAQTISLCWQLWFFSRPTELLHFQPRIFRLRWDIVRDSLSIGLSPFLMNVASCTVVIFLNQSLLRYGGDLAIGAFGIINRLTFLVVMIVMGFNQGMQPIAGYNYGAKQMDRVHRVLVLTIICATIVTTTGGIIGELFPRALTRIFVDDSDNSRALIDFCVVGMRYNFLLFPIIGFQMVTGNYFQSIGRAKISIFLSLSRQLIFLLPAILILPIWFGLEGVWAALPLSDFIASIVAGAFLIRELQSESTRPKLKYRPLKYLYGRTVRYLETRINR